MSQRIPSNPAPSTAAQTMLDGIQKAIGATPNIFKTMAHSPATLNFYLQGSGALKETALSAAMREQLALVVAGANHCDYCASAHTAIGAKQNLTAAEMAANLSGQSGDAKTQAALSFARQIVETRGNVSDAAVEAVRAAGYSEGEILEIVTVVSFNIFTNYFNHVAGTEIDFPVVSTANVKQAA